MKRFTATEKWIDPWYMRLSADHKIAWGYILDNCDSAGVWDRNEELASFQIGSQVNWAEFRKALDKRIQELPNGKWWVLGFIEFQYGELKPTAGVHRAVIDRLKRHGLWDRYVIEMGLKSHQEEVQAKEEEKDQGGECKGEGAQRPSLAEVKAYAQTIGLAEWKAVDFFEKHETTGWIERGEPMRRWQNAMNRTKTYWEAEGRPMKPPTRGHQGNGQMTVHEARAVLEAKQRRADEIKNKYSSETASGRTWSDQKKRQEYVEIRGEIKALNEKISKMC